MSLIHFTTNLCRLMVLSARVGVAVDMNRFPWGQILEFLAKNSLRIVNMHAVVRDSVVYYDSLQTAVECE